jgi:hypothetical protein
VVDTASVVLDTLRLGREPDPGALQRAWHEVDTSGLAQLVLEEGVALWLYRRLKSAGAESAPEAGFATWLSQRAREDAAKNLLADARVSELGGWLTGNGYPHVWIKGSARRLAAALYPYADARATNDVDLILPQDRVREAWDQLQRSGYEPTCSPDRARVDHFHLAALWNQDRVAVELHLSTSREVPPDDAWRRATTLAVTVNANGLGFPVPSATELLWQGIAHGLLHGTGGFRLRYFQDASVILAGTEPIHWGEIARRLDSPEVPSRGVTLSWLGAAAELAGRSLPPELSGVPAFDLIRALRWRLAVHRHAARHPRAAEKLVEEGTRAEIGWPILSGVPGTSPAVRMRRRVAAVAARGAYLAWRQFARPDGRPARRN